MNDFDYRKAVLLVILILVVGLCLYRYRDLWPFGTDSPKPSVIVVEDRTASLSLDEETRAEIVDYFRGVRIPPEENNLDFARSLDSVGRSQLSEGNDEEAHSTYQKVLAISYQQGSLKGIGTALLALSEIAERGDHQGEALGVVLLLSKMAEAMGREEKEVMELRLARLLEQQDGIEMQMTGILEEGAEEGPERTTLASESEAATPPGSDSTDGGSEAATPPANDSTDREVQPAKPAPKISTSGRLQVNPRILQLADQIEIQVSRFRGLPVGQPIVKTFAKREEIEKRLLELAHELNPPSQVEVDKKALVKLGLIPRSFALAEFLRRTALLSTVSLYDPRTKTLYIADSLTGMEDGEVEDEIVVSLVMNLVHALQDRHFNLTPYSVRVEGNDDASMARLALVLGDALAVLVDYSVSSQLLSPAQVSDVDLSFRQEIESQLGEDVPEALREINVFPAVAGFKFMRSFRKWNSLEDATRLYSDFPRSTEQFMHPEKYLAQRDDPTIVEWQPPPIVLSVPWKRIDTNVLGELSLYLVLNRFIERHKAVRASQGWDGDRLELFEHPNGNLAFVLRSVWDTEEDAREFAAAYSDLVQKKYPGAQLVNAGGNRRTEIKELQWESDGNRIILRVNGSEVEIIEVEPI
ncbi:MAG: hypothetical protein IH794_08860 [Acidobacteria bacterium]|nr:hypothetical protein [Acidobacteriota bacterium]